MTANQVTGELHTWDHPRKGRFTGAIVSRREKGYDGGDYVVVRTVEGKVLVVDLADLTVVPE